MGELLLRIDQINWTREQCDCGKRFLVVEWSAFGALLVKDFHSDLGSLMDSLAPLIIHVSGAEDLTKEKKLPGFVDIQSNGSSRSIKFRNLILQSGKDLIGVIDSSDCWWPDIKKIRDILLHREHQKIMFGSPRDGPLFQIYTKKTQATVIDPVVLWSSGHNVVDFALYSAAILVELVMFMEMIAQHLVKSLKISLESIKYTSARAGDYGYLLDAFAELKSRLETPKGSW